mmetsp:Transcript_25982/g.36825  ORF Transcript_25982/g.36825 Transcript_25982/m.36825 type:complete len:403 (-) Transcript_25982:468-1676(-)
MLWYEKNAKWHELCETADISKESTARLQVCQTTKEASIWVDGKQLHTVQLYYKSESIKFFVGVSGHTAQLDVSLFASGKKLSLLEDGSVLSSRYERINRDRKSCSGADSEERKESDEGDKGHNDEDEGGDEDDEKKRRKKRKVKPDEAAAVEHGKEKRKVKPAAAGVSSKKAMVVGVAYKKPDDLKCPEQDAEDVADTLNDIGFSVTLMNGKLDGTKLREAVLKFHDSLKPHDVALFYFSGHGWEHEGENWLLATEIPKDKRMLSSKALSADFVLKGMKKKTVFQLMILDCCRTVKTFQRSTKSIDRVGGLAAQVSSLKGSMITYACAPKTTALDGTGRNSIYTKHLLKHLRTANLNLYSLFTRVSNGVQTEAKEQNFEQIPWFTSSIDVENPCLVEETTHM